MRPNPWRNLPLKSDYVLPEDKLAVDVFNRDAAPKVRLHVDTPPEPFFGPFDAPVVLLLLNPGVSTADKYDDGLADTVRTSDARARHFYVGRQNKWWDRLVRPLASAGPKMDIARSILSVEFFPYRSISFGCSYVRLSSQEFSFSLVRQAIERKAAIVVGRGERQWVGAVPELRSKCALLRLNNPRMASLSAANLGDEGFRRVTRVLRAMA